MLFTEALHIAKASPLLMFSTAILGYFLTYQKTLFLLIGFSGNTLINYIVKHYVVKPIMEIEISCYWTGTKTKEQVLGFLRFKITDVKSYGMPSGAQMAGFSQLIVCKIIDDRVSTFLCYSRYNIRLSLLLQCIVELKQNVIHYNKLLLVLC